MTKLAGEIVFSDQVGKEQIIGDDLAGSHHEVVADGGMHVGVELRRQRILLRELRKEGRVGITEHPIEVLILEDNQYNVGQISGLP
jgi:hypothetical protein